MASLLESTGYHAVDPNLIDADIFNAAPNMQGAVVSVAHNRDGWVEFDAAVCLCRSG